MMFRLFAVIVLHLAVTCMAQNSSLPKGCPVEIQHIDDGNLIYNSTRTARTRFTGHFSPWYITAAITDRRAPTVTFGDVDTSQELSVFISVPKTLPEPGNPAGSDVRLCSSMLKALNRTSENPPDMNYPDHTSYANHSCKGVISEKCINEFENSGYAVDGPIKTCRSLVSLNISDECRDYLWIGQTNPRNFSRAAARCSVDKMPYIDLPKDYITFGTGLWTGLIGDEDREDFDMYDLRVQQTIPLLFAASGMSMLICMAPDQVVPGSRKPQLKLEEDEPEEDENSASRAAAIFLGVGAIIFSLL